MANLQDGRRSILSPGRRLVLGAERSLVGPIGQPPGIVSTFNSSKIDSKSIFFGKNGIIMRFFPPDFSFSPYRRRNFASFSHKINDSGVVGLCWPPAGKHSILCSLDFSCLIKIEKKLRNFFSHRPIQMR
uniref:Uncharacterized protein n=1 Tax=Romanomermis culicivorax TaxID=13658 RepID=A0A915JSV2_ROMCU